MDVLRVLTSPDLEVRKKTLALVLELINSRNVDEVMIKVRVACCHTVFAVGCVGAEEGSNWHQ